MLSDGANAHELTVVNEGQVVLVHVVFEKEEWSRYPQHVRNQNTERHCDSVRHQGVRAVITEVEGISVNEGGFADRVLHLLSVSPLEAPSHDVVRDVQEPPAHRQESQLNKVHHEVVVL